MVLLAVLLFAVVLRLHGVLTEDDCVRSIRDYDEQDYQALAADPWKFSGFYSYILPCGGIVTSIEARGLCRRPDNVEMQLITGANAERGIGDLSNYVLLVTKCNKTAKVGNNYEGYVSATGLEIRVPRDGVLMVHLNPDCSSTRHKCLFQPAVINETSKYDVVFADSHLEWSRPNMSLFFSANITELPDENKKESESSNITFMIIGVLSLLLLCGTLGIIALSIKRCGSKISASGEIPTSTNEAYWKVERERGNELLKINGEPAAKSEEMMYDVVLSPAPSSRPLPTIPFPLSGGTEEEDCTTAVYEVIPGDH